MQYWRILRRVIALSFQRELAFRTNLFFGLLMTLVEILAGVAMLTVLYTQVERLAGWKLGEALVLLGAFQVVTGLLNSFVEPNLSWFAVKVTRGELDDTLLQPVPSLFLASLGSCRPLALSRVILGMALAGVGLLRLGSGLTVTGLLTGVTLLAAGAVVTWATRVLVAASAFWAPGFEPSILYDAFWQLGRYPVSVYPAWVGRLLTYVVPVALVSTLPAMALTRNIGLSVILPALAAVVAAVLVVVRVWRAGLRRYTGATS